MDREKAAGCRRSARISALEEKAYLLSLQKKTNNGQSGNYTEPSPSTVTKKRGRKRKSLLEAGVNSVATEEGDESEDEREFFHQDALAAGSLSIPDKDKLKCILDLLQSADAHKIFVKPVDPSEVEGYSDLVKEPMDFGTMRTKLETGKYTSLEQFERDLYLITSILIRKSTKIQRIEWLRHSPDVIDACSISNNRDIFLISSNAMTFNSPTTMFHQEAEALHQLAHKVFHNLRNEQQKFHVESSRTRRQSGRQSGSRSPNSRSVGDPRGGDRRMTYQPPVCASKSGQDADDNVKFSFDLDAPRKLVRMPFPPGAYEDSINRYSKDLGPVVQRVAQKKLAELRAIRPSERTEAPDSANVPWIPGLAGSRPASLVPQLSENFVMDHGQWGHPSLGRRPEASRDASGLMSVAPILPGRRSTVNLLPGQYKACDNQVLEPSAERILQGRTSSEIPNANLFPASPSVHMHTRFNWAPNEQVQQDISNFVASNKGRALSSDDSRNSFSFFCNPISNTERWLSTGMEGRLTSPDKHSPAQGRTSHPDEENVEQFLAILRGNNSSETTPPSQSPLDSNFPSASSSSVSRLTPPPTSSSPLANPSGGMWLPFQSENRLDEATRTYLQELRSGCFNAIATSNAALRYPNERSTRPVGYGQLSPMDLRQMHHFPNRQMQINEHDPSPVRTAFPLQRPQVAPSEQPSPVNWAGHSGGAVSQDCQEQSIVSRSLWDMLQPPSLRRNGDQQPGNLDLNL